MSFHLLGRLLVPLLLAAMIVLIGCGEQGPQRPAPGPAIVTVSQPLEQDVTEYAHFTGRTAAVESVEVRARVGGYLVEVAFQAGQEVKQGQLLFRIDPTIYQAALDRAKADVARYEAEVTYSGGEYERSRRLVGGGAVSREELERISSQTKQATANLQAARAAVKTARQNLSWTRVVSPIDGKADVNLLTRGNLVVADQTLLTTIVSQDPMYAYFDVDESTMLRVQRLIREGKATSYREAAYPIAIRLSNEQGYPHQGTIDFASNQVSRGTGTLQVRGRFPNKDRVLTPGLFVRVRVPIGRPHKGLLVSERALSSDQGQRYLLVVDGNNEVVRRNVQVGALQEGGLREVTSGLQRDEWVIVDGLLRVRPGVKAEPKRQPMPLQHRADDKVTK